MKTLSFEKMECIQGGCSFDEMVYYATSALYHMGNLSPDNQYYVYHYASMSYNTARLMACM